MYFLRTLDVAECSARGLWAPRRQSNSNKKQVCKKMFDNRLIALVKVAALLFVPRCGFLLNRFSRRKQDVARSSGGPFVQDHSQLFHAAHGSFSLQENAGECGT
jgi:hypothetical protein